MSKYSVQAYIFNLNKKYYVQCMYEASSPEEALYLFFAECYARKEGPPEVNRLTHLDTNLHIDKIALITHIEAMFEIYNFPTKENIYERLPSKAHW